MPEFNFPTFSLLLVTDRPFKEDEPVRANEVWRVVLATHCEICKQCIIDPRAAVAVLQNIGLEGMPGDFLGRVERHVNTAGSTVPEYFYGIRGRVFIVHDSCDKPPGLQVPASTVLGIHSVVADFKPGLPMTDTMKRPN